MSPYDLLLIENESTTPRNIRPRPCADYSTKRAARRRPRDRGPANVGQPPGAFDAEQCFFDLGLARVGVVGPFVLILVLDSLVSRVVEQSLSVASRPP